jgi:hypothetical protein
MRRLRRQARLVLLVATLLFSLAIGWFLLANTLAPMPPGAEKLGGVRLLVSDPSLKATMSVSVDPGVSCRGGTLINLVLDFGAAGSSSRARYVLLFRGDAMLNETPKNLPEGSTWQLERQVQVSSALETMDQSTSYIDEQDGWLTGPVQMYVVVDECMITTVEAKSSIHIAERMPYFGDVDPADESPSVGPLTVRFVSSTGKQAHLAGQWYRPASTSVRVELFSDYGATQYKIETSLPTEPQREPSGSLVWQGDRVLSPRLLITDVEAQDHQAQLAFIGAVLLGVLTAVAATLGVPFLEDSVIRLLKQ